MHESEPVQEGLQAPGSEGAASKGSKYIAYCLWVRFACAFLIRWDARNDAQFGAETMPGLPALCAGENAAISVEKWITQTWLTHYVTSGCPKYCTLAQGAQVG